MYGREERAVGEGSFADIICLRMATPLSGLSIRASSLYAGMCLEVTSNITSASLRKRDPSYRKQIVHLHCDKYHCCE